MAYEPVGPQAKGPQVSVEDDAGLNIRYDAGAYNNAPHATQDRDTEYSGDDIKGVSQKWPSHLQKVAAITPLKVLVFLFDVILASTPIMFLGEYARSQGDCFRPSCLRSIISTTC
jgi:hypothetical protein